MQLQVWKLTKMNKNFDHAHLKNAIFNESLMTIHIDHLQKSAHRRQRTILKIPQQNQIPNSLKTWTYRSTNSNIKDSTNPLQNLMFVDQASNMTQMTDYPWRCERTKNHANAFHRGPYIRPLSAHKQHFYTAKVIWLEIGEKPDAAGTASIRSRCKWRERNGHAKPTNQ
jgi:hypothetical protein